MGPVWKPLKSLQNDEEWNLACRGALRSTIAGIQYPQTRVFAAGWSEHNRCVLCLHDIVQADAAKNGTTPRSVAENSSSTDGNVLNCEGIERLVVAPAMTDGFKPEQKEKIKAVVATVEQISRGPGWQQQSQDMEVPSSTVKRGQVQVVKRS